MKIYHVKSTAFTVVSVCVSLAYAVLAFFFGVGPLLALLEGALMFTALFFRFEFAARFPWWGSQIVLLSASVLTFLTAQLCCGAVFEMTFLKLLLNVVMIYGAIALISALTGSIKAGIISFYSFTILLSVADHFVVQTRNFEIQLIDLFSISTGMSVAADYKYTIGQTVAACLLASISLLVSACVNRFPKLKGFPARSVISLVGIASIAIVFSLALTPSGLSKIGFRSSYVKYQMSDYNGFYLGIAKSFGTNAIDMPRGYSAKTLDQEFDLLITEEEKTAAKRPNVIVIMNETFADLEYVCDGLGYDLEPSSDPLEYFHSLKDADPNVIKGYMYSSVFGGNTANSEFEFLTANSMAFVDSMAVPYNGMLNDETAFSLVDIFNGYGYRTIGMHPQNKNNYHRTKIYESLRFDEQYFMDGNTFVDGNELTDDEYYRGHVTDKAIYDRIIGLLEETDGDQPVFVFAVTMQNHGGYGVGHFESEITAGDNEPLNEYLTTVSHSDSELEYLLEHFAENDGDTVIVYFGDHQPSINDEFYAGYMGLDENSPVEASQSKYTVPYMIWASYDLPEDAGDGYTMSINYLGTRLLDVLGFEKTDYIRLVEKVREDIPAINAFGWWDRDYNFNSIDTIKNTMSPFNKNTPEHLLYVYYCAEYNMLADRNEKLIKRFSAD